MDPALQSAAELAQLALVVWREARGQAREVKAAVAWSILTRVADPGWWGTDLLSVIACKWQYGSMTDPRDPQLTTWPLVTDASYVECLEVARGVIDGTEPNPAPGADSYYDTSIDAPKWATPPEFKGAFGPIRFYAVRPEADK